MTTTLDHAEACSRCGLVHEPEELFVAIGEELGEARHHGAPIDPIRLKVLDPQPSVDMTGWSDPAWRRNHSDCIALCGYPLARQLLNAASHELARRYPYDAFDDERFRQIINARHPREAREPN